MKNRFRPFVSKKSPKINFGRAPINSGGEEADLPPYSWISDGPIQDIEKGLPIIESPPPAYDAIKNNPMQKFVSLLVDRDYMKDFGKMYGRLAGKFPELTVFDPENLSTSAKQFIADNSNDISEQIIRATSLSLNHPINGRQNSQIPKDSHLHTWGGLIPSFDSQIFNEETLETVAPESKKIKKKTGIYGGTYQNSPNSTEMIRELHFRSISDEEIRLQPKTNFSNRRPLEIKRKSKSKSLSETKLANNLNDSTVKQCMNEYFSPNRTPFVPKSVQDYFPLELLQKNNEKSIIQRTSTNDDDADIEFQDAFDTPSTLLDTSDQDVLFTKEKTPFTRTEVAKMRAFNDHWDSVKLKKNNEIEEQYQRERKFVRRAFQSREVFKTYLELLEKDRKRIESGIIGKSPYKKKSLWEVANEKAPFDNTSLENRMKMWWKFCMFYSTIEETKGDMMNEISIAMRSLLMEVRPVDQSLFLDFVKSIPKESFGSIHALKLVEFCRVILCVEYSDFQKILKDSDLSSSIYNQIIASNISEDLNTTINTIIKQKVTLPDIY